VWTRRAGLKRCHRWSTFVVVARANKEKNKVAPRLTGYAGYIEITDGRNCEAAFARRLRHRDSRNETLQKSEGKHHGNEPFHDDLRIRNWKFAADKTLAWK